MTRKDWSAVRATQQREGCHCELRKDMPREELVALASTSCTMPNYCCPAVSQYLRLLPATPMEDDE